MVTERIGLHFRWPFTRNRQEEQSTALTGRIRKVVGLIIQETALETKELTDCIVTANNLGQPLVNLTDLAVLKVEIHRSLVESRIRMNLKIKRLNQDQKDDINLHVQEHFAHSGPTHIETDNSRPPGEVMDIKAQILYQMGAETAADAFVAFIDQYPIYRNNKPNKFEIRSFLGSQIAELERVRNGV